MFSVVHFENTKKSEVRKSESPKLHPPELFAKLGRKIGVKKGGLLRFYLQELWNFRTFALSIGTMELERRAPKICFQAWQNFLPAQSVKKKSQMETKWNQNKN